MGVRNVEPVNGGGDWTITRPDHWMFDGTGMKRGDSIPGLVGWELPRSRPIFQDYKSSPKGGFRSAARNRSG